MLEKSEKLARFGSFVLLTLIVSIGGCYNNKSVNDFINEPRIPVASSEYRVYPPDLLLISSDNMREFRPELGKRGMQILVRPDGMINTPLIGEIYCAGKTIDEIEKAILHKAGKYYSQATVNVDVMQFNSQRFYVFGEVANPGPKQWTGRDSLLDALGQAQPTSEAWYERILVIRGDSPQEGGRRERAEKDTRYFMTGVRSDKARNKRKKMVVNYYAMTRHGDMSNNILLLPNDIIFVQPDPFVEIGRRIRNIVYPFEETADGVESIRSIFDKNYDRYVFTGGSNAN